MSTLEMIKLILIATILICAFAGLVLYGKSVRSRKRAEFLDGAFDGLVILCILIFSGWLITLIISWKFALVLIGILVVIIICMLIGEWYSDWSIEKGRRLK